MKIHFIYICILCVNLFTQAQIPIQHQPGYATISDLKLIYENGSPFSQPQMEATITSTWDFYEINYREVSTYSTNYDTIFNSIYIKNCFYQITEEIYDYERYTALPLNATGLIIFNIYSDTSTINDWYCPNQNFYGLLASDTILANEVVTASLNEVSAPQLSLYPNPASDFINVKTENPALLKRIEIKAMDGTTVLEQKESEKIPVAHLAAGVYFIHVRYNATTITKKFVKE
ncbi:MAG: T9SS type A sorting domain-containing protein [Lishizhenia sp.]